MFDTTYEYDINTIQVFTGQGWAEVDLDHKWVNLNVTQ